MITLDRGIQVRGIDFWLDATRARSTPYISHAYQDHVAGDRQAIIFSEQHVVHGFPEPAEALKKIGFLATRLDTNRQLKPWED